LLTTIIHFYINLLKYVYMSVQERRVRLLPSTDSYRDTLQIVEDKQPWKSSLPLREQLSSWEGNGFLMKADNPLLLRKAIVTSTPSPDRALVANCIDYLLEDFDKRPEKKKYREDGVTLSIMHELRVGLREAMEPDATGLDVVMAAYHDKYEEEVPEYQDAQKLRETFLYTFTTLFGRSAEEASLVHLSMTTFDKRLQPDYYGNLTQVHLAHPHLRLWRKKGKDRLDSFIGDMSLSLRLATSQDSASQQKMLVSRERIRKSRRKLEVVLPFVEQYAPEIMGDMNEALALSDEILAETFSPVIIFPDTSISRGLE
jgi:hypothetical protein